jgi:xanthine dehydrogenase YagR molybdenum-binding subunit
MRAPGEATGMMAFEIAMDEMAEKLGIDPVEFRILNDTQVVPDNPGRPPSSIRNPKNTEGNAPKSQPTRQALFATAICQCLRWAPSASDGTSAIHSRAKIAMDAG